MNIEELRIYCLSKDGADEAMPFGESTVVFRVGSFREGAKAKMFALISLDKPNYILLKCDPERAIELREKYDEIEAGWHMNKRHWNGVYTDGTLPASVIRELIDHSYSLVRGRK